MATYNGSISEDVLYPNAVLVCSASIRNWVGFDTGDLYKSGDVVWGDIGVHTSNLPVSEREITQTGQRQLTFVDDYYYRIHIDPATFALGAILSPTEEEFIVWNAWFTDKTCSAVNEVNPEEFDISGLSAPFTLSGLEYDTYILEVPMEGSLEFTASATFVFPDESPVLNISGTRVSVFSWEPLLPMQEQLKWNTNIMKSKDGSEQRMSIRTTPRQLFNMEVYLKDEQYQARLDANLFGWQKRSWALPVWTEWTLHTASIAVDDTVIYLDTTNADYRDSSSAIIWQSPTSYEAVKIDTVAADRLNLETPIQNNWSGNKWIMPLRNANVRASVQRPAAPDGYGRATFNFIVQDNELLTGYTPPTTYKTLPVITDSSIVEPEQEVKSDSDAKFTDYGLGKFQMYSDSDFNIFVQSHVFRNLGKANCWSFRKFLHYLFGRQGAFWVISDRDDLQLLTTIGSSDVNFNVANIKLANNMGLNTLRTHLAFVLPSGTHYYREITGITESDATTEIITIDSSLGVSLAPGDCEICFLDKCRLTEDTVTFDWQEPFDMWCRTNFTRVKE